MNCLICGEEIQCMVGEHQAPDDAYVALRGQWMWLPSMDAPFFVLDPDSELSVYTLENGQIALLPNEDNRPTLHLHKDCQESIVHESEGVLPDEVFLRDIGDYL
jgi:hypothetical protein